MPTKTIGEIARDAAEKIGDDSLIIENKSDEFAVDFRLAFSFANASKIIAAAIREACAPFRAIAMNAEPARTVFQDGSRHSPEFYAGHREARHQIAEAIAAALAERESTTKPT